MKNKNKSARILVVDDNPGMRERIGKPLKNAGYDVVYAADAFPAIKIIKDDPKIDLVTLDLKMPQMHGLEVLAKLLEIRSDLPVIIITGTGTISYAVEAMQSGAYDFLESDCKPEKILVTVSNALKYKRLKDKQLEDCQLIGESQAMIKVRKMINMAAASDQTVLITGGTGTGKDLVAKNIHKLSKRSEKPFIIVNTVAVPAQLFESDIFGHLKGAFTGAISNHKGKYELADSGTIFFDEIGDLTQDLQVKLLRVIEDGTFYKVGSEKSMFVDVRHIFATNADLVNKVKTKNFREDFYYRINVLNIQLPSLRDRRDDIPVLFEHFLSKFSAEDYIEKPEIENHALNKLIDHDWRGNVRELENTARRIIASRPELKITSQDMTDVMLNVNKSDGEIKPLQESINELTKTEIIKTLCYTNQNREEAARLLGISRSQLFRYLKQFNLTKPKTNN